jgi:hypothetical protein
MATIPYKTAEAFLRQERSRNGKFISTGDAIYSYAWRLAYWQDGKIVRDKVDIAPFSVTTARHISALKAVIGEAEGK